MADLTITINETTKGLACSANSLGLQGVACSVDVVVPASLIALGLSAYCDFILPDGASYYKGPYDCSSGTFTMALGTLDSIKDKDGYVTLQVWLGTIVGTVRTNTWISKQTRLQVESSILATSSAILPYVPQMVYPLDLPGVFNVKDYGAIGDGVADDTDAIADARDALVATGKGVLYFPPGTYLNKATIAFSNITLAIIGHNATILAGILQSYVFTLNNCQDAYIQGITFDQDYVDTSILYCINQKHTTIRDCIFKDMYVDLTDTGNKHALYLYNAPYTLVDNCKFYNIGETRGVDPTDKQYRCISINEGCDQTKAVNCLFDNAHQAFVTTDYYYWRNGADYDLNDRVNFIVDGVINEYYCILASGSGTNDPSDASYWTLRIADVRPTENIFIDKCRITRIKANGIYAINNNIATVYLTNCYFQAVVQPIVVRGNAVINANVFRDCSIAIRVHQNGAETIIISNNYYWEDSRGSFLDWRDIDATNVLKKLIITGNNVTSTQAAIANYPLLYLGLIEYALIADNIFDTAYLDYEDVILFQKNFTHAIVTGNVIKAAPETVYYYPFLKNGTGELYEANNQFVGSFRITGVSNRIRSAQTAGEIADGDSFLSDEIAMLYAQVGDVVIASCKGDLQGCSLTAYASSAGKVRIVINNNTGGTKTFAELYYTIRIVDHPSA